ncbi:MAG: galactosyldiacylglycerol synthase [Acidobacteriia bacterium]|nr:galactosyldiacylglycerol synthase [Terriglobia bacterium]
MSRKPLIDLIYIDSGGGHRAAAQAIEAVVGEERKPWDLCLHGAQDLLNSIDFIRKATGIPFEEIYNILLRRGWTRGSRQLIVISHLLIRMSHRSQVEVLAEHWRNHPVDMVVSLIPHYNRALCQAFASVCPGRPFVTIMTDIADYPPHFWIEEQDQYLICGSERASDQARRLHLPAERILPMSGMILHPRFHKAAAERSIDRASQRIALGLQPDLPTGLVLFGGIGSNDTVRVVRALNRQGSGLQLIVLCGRHEASLAALRAMDAQIPMHIEGFTKEVPYFMSLADFFIGKPGPGSISEALAMNLPVVVECNLRTMVHERYNAQWVREQQVGLVVENFDTIEQAVAELLQPDHFHRFRANASRLRNTAVYDAVEWLERILEKHPVADGDARTAEALVASKH